MKEKRKERKKMKRRNSTSTSPSVAAEVLVDLNWIYNGFKDILLQTKGKFYLFPPLLRKPLSPLLIQMKLHRFVSKVKSPYFKIIRGELPFVRKSRKPFHNSTYLQLINP